VRRVVDPVNGIPAKLRYLPTVAEVTLALNEERARRSQIRATAAWMLREHDRRKAEAAERERWSLSEEELERRRKQVAELMASRPAPEAGGEA